MPMDLNWKKIMTGAIVLSLATGSGTAVLSSPVQVKAESLSAVSPFTDVNAGHWAEKHIAKLYHQSIINGYVNSADGSTTFKPENSVSQQEAVLMALRFAGIVDQADDDAIIVFDESFVVSEFFKAYIELAFTEGLLDREEEYALAAADTENTWGAKPASREWVTKLIVRAIGQKAAADQLQNSESHFEDAADIDTRYAGYVNAAVQLGLVKGMTETTFAPDQPVTRASLATLFSRAQASFPMEYDGQSSGIISDLTDTSLTLYSDDEETTYTLDSSTLYFHYNSEKPITKDQLLEYGDVTVIAKDGKALYVEVQGETQHTETITGTFARYNASESTIYIWVNDKPVAINYESDLLIEDTEGTPLSILDLKANAAVTIVQDTFRAEPVALQIIASATPVVTQLSGTLVSADQKFLTVKTEDGHLETKYVALGATVELTGLTNASFDDLVGEEELEDARNADMVEVTLNAVDQVTKVKVTNRKVEVSAGGTINSYDEKNKFIYGVDANNEPLALKLTEQTKFDYMGTSVDLAAAMTLTETNANVVIRYTRNEVVSISFVMAYTGTVSQIDTKNKQITIVTADGVTVKLPYVNTVVEMMNKPLANHLDIKTGDIVTLNMNPAKVEVMATRVHRTVSYSIASVDVTNKKIRVRSMLDETFDILLSSADIYKVDGSKITIGLLKAGNSIDVTFVGTTATKVQLTDKAASNG